VGRGKVALWDERKPLTPTPPIAPSDRLRRQLRFATYRKGDRLAVHAVNYNVCLLDKASRVISVDPTPLEVPVPDGWKDVKATCFDPDAAPATLACTVVDRTARLTLPKSRVYQVVLLERQ
jgi:hypothetical protein